MYGRPRALGDVIDKLDAVLYCWYGGSQMGNAVANIIFGKVSPSGKLPITLPRSTGQIPTFYNLPALRDPSIIGYWRGLNSCSILEAVVKLYNLTGEKRYFDFASYIVDCGGTDVANIFELAYENKLYPYQYPVTKAYEIFL